MLSDFYPLGLFPTPIHFLKRLSEKHHPYRLYIKRDDQTGLAMGGNKTRKLEYLIYQALAQQCDTVITAGATQSNHCRQTAAACAIAGLSCHLLLYGKPFTAPTGNLLLDHLFGATIHWHDDGHTQESVAGRLRSDGAKPYLIPVGGSNETGSLGYVKAMKEFHDQQSQLNIHFDYIVIPTSSGGTQAGMLAGQKWFHIDTHIIGINIDKNPIFDKPVEDHIFEIANRALFGLNPELRIQKKEIHINHDLDHSGYGVLTGKEIQVIRTMAREEGILLDPVYTGRAFGGLQGLLDSQYFKKDSAILFWHTGGAPALFGYAEQFLPEK